MLFNSFEFFIFFPIVTIAYFILPHKCRWALLLGASYYFYMAWKPEYIILILLSTVIDYCVSLKMAKIEVKRKRKLYLYMSLFSNLGLLFYFKYFSFFYESFMNGASYFSGFEFGRGGIEIAIPMGISFYTFQTLSYTIDVYKGKRKAEKNFGIFALYVTFFPQLVAGPIERSETLLPQFYEKHNFEYERVVSGMRRILWGLFKKMVIADQISVIVDQIYDKPKSYYGIPLIIGTIGFAIQIYCDFSGYSDIAIGSARVLGFKLMENFKMPYFAKSISEFWKRWHISLSTWFKDYLYIPLGGNRVAVKRVYINVFITFLISGLWHGANWTFVIWGAIHGGYLVIERMTYSGRKKMRAYLNINEESILYSLLRRGVTFALVCYGWIFFRAENVSDALYISKNIFKGLGNIKDLSFLSEMISGFKLRNGTMIILIISILIMCIAQIITKRDDAISAINEKNIVLRWSVYFTLVMMIIFFGAFSSQNFLYFQF